MIRKTYPAPGIALSGRGQYAPDRAAIFAYPYKPARPAGTRGNRLAAAIGNNAPETPEAL